MKRMLIVAIAVLSFCHCAVCSAKTFDTPYFRFNLPDHFQSATPPPEVGAHGEGGFAYVFFIGKEKGKDKTMFIIATGEKMSDKARTMRDRALSGITDELRKSIMKSQQCQGDVSDIVRVRIGKGDALFFEKVNRDCKTLNEKYWTATSSEHFVTFYIAKRANADERTYDQCIEAIGKVVLK